MKRRTLLGAALLCALSLAACQVAGGPDLAGSDIPHLRQQGTATQLIVDGKPFLALAGELGNNTATSLDYMRHVWPKLLDTHLKHRAGRRFLGPDRTAGRPVRLQRA